MSFLTAGCREHPPATTTTTTTTTARRREKIRAIAFDLFTLFDPTTVARVAERVLPGRAVAFCDTWRVRQFEYSWIHAAAGQYRDFRAVTEEALSYAAEVHDVVLTEEARATLLCAYEELDPWPDTRPALEAFKRAGLVLAPLANYTPTMIERLLRHGGVRDLFDHVISTDRARTFKPDPRAYALGPQVFGLARESIAFSAFGGWDAAGARWFGYPTFWVNRLGQAKEQLRPGPDATGSTLRDLAAWIERSGA
ncbi:MAG: haloacid dehalogenase, type II [Myxococcales bacterium 68-20]|nr:MAG: haloacid dehalogenase, type II [Myxococcales bacterium 68-20]